MRIISKFRDYYDGVQAFGFDDTLTYVRHEKTINIEIKDPSVDRKNQFKYHDNPFGSLTYVNGRVNSMNIYTSPITVGFCGKVISACHIKTDKSIYGNNPIVDEYVYDIDTVYHLMMDSFDKKTKKEFNDLWHSKKTSCYYGVKKNCTKENFQRFFDSDKSHFEHLFIEYNTPAFVYRAPPYVRRGEKGMDLIINPCLKDYNFYKKVDAYTAHQEIDMYLSGVLGNTEVDMVNISDKDMRDQKGFDDWSFKKLPTKHKQRVN